MIKLMILAIAVYCILYYISTLVDRYRELEKSKIPVQDKSPYNIGTVLVAGYREVAGKYPPKKVAYSKPTKIQVPVVEWRICSHKDLPEPSPAEALIIKELNKYRINWVREVEFLEHKSSNYGYYRYDFYLRDYNIVIEYDGKTHNNDNRLAVDKAKDDFCASKGIIMVRYNRKHFYNMKHTIEVLMKDLKVKKRF
jgi:very-short-patch-repair endonuclease